MKRNLIAILMMTAALASGCGAKASDTTTTAATQAETTQAATTQAGASQTETTQAASQEAEAKTEVITGKIEEIKDFMFTIENDQGTYAMTFDTAPEGLADVKEGLCRISCGEGRQPESRSRHRCRGAGFLQRAPDPRIQISQSVLCSCRLSGESRRRLCPGPECLP